MLGERLKELRKLKGVTQEDLARILNLERSSIGKYEGKSAVIPSADVLNSMAKYFDVSIDYLLGRTEQKKAYPPYDEHADNFVPAAMRTYNALSPELRKQADEYLDFLLAKEKAYQEKK